MIAVETILKERIVYVDSEALNLRGFQLLYGDDYDIQALRSPSHALDFLSKNEVDLIITDQKMSEMSGIDFLRKVRKFWPHTATVLLSAYSDYDALVAAVNEIGIFQFVSKPYDLDKMGFVINNAIESTRLKRMLHSKERELEVSQMKLSKIVETATDGIITVDNDSKIVMANKSAAKMFGYTNDELINMPMRELVPEEHDNGHDTYVGRFKQGEDSSSYMGLNTVIYGKDSAGYLFPIETTLSKMKIGDTVYFNAFIRNVKDRVEMQNKLRKSEEKFKGVFDSMINLFTRVANDGTIALISPSVQNVLGYTPEEVMGTQVIQYCDRLEDREFLNEILQKEGVYNDFQVSIIAKDGSKRILSIDAKHYKDKEGNILGIESVARDVTEQMQLKLKIRENNVLMQKAQSLAHLGTWEWSVADNTVMWSDELYRIYGLDKNKFECSFDAYIANIHPDDREKVAGIIRGALTSNKPVHFEERIIRPNGEIRHLNSWGNTVFDEDGNPVRMFGACLDITESKQKENALENNQDRAVLLSKVLGLSSQNIGMNECVSQTIQLLSEFIDCQAAHVHVYSEENDHLETSNIWYFDPAIDDQEVIMEFKDVSRDLTFALGQGLPGKAWKEKSVQWVSDVVEECKCGKNIQVSRLEIKGAFAFPVLRDGQVVAVFEFYLNNAERPNDQLFRLCNDISDRLSIIFDRIRTNDVLKENEKSLRTAQIVAKMGSWEYNSLTEELKLSTGEFVLLNLSPNTKRKLTLDDLIGMIHEDDREMLRRMIKIPDRLTTNKYEYRLRNKFGSIRYIHSFIKIIRDENGVATGILGTDRDVTEQRRTELRNNVVNSISRKLNSNLSLHKFCTYIFEQLSNVKSFPNFYISQYDNSKEELSISFQVLNNKIQRNLPKPRVRGNGLSEHIIRTKSGIYLNGNELSDFEKEHGLKLYGKRAKSWIGVPLIAEDRVVGVLASQSFEKTGSFTKDDLDLLSFIGTQIGSLVERHKVEKEIRQFEKYFSVSMDLMCIAGTDAFFKKINPKFSELLGYSEEELLSKSFIEFIHPDDVKFTYEQIEQLSNGVSNINFTNRYYCSDKGYKWLMWSATYDKDSEQIFAAAKDITEQKRSKDILEAIADIQSSFIEHTSIKEAFEKMLRVLLNVVNSECGFIAEVIDEGGSLRHEIHATWNSSIKTTQNGNPEEGINNDSEFLDELANLVLKEGEPVMLNNINNFLSEEEGFDDDSKVENFMGLPFFDNKEMIGIVGITNNSKGYSERDIVMLKPVLVTCSTLIKARQDDIKKKNAEKELQQLADIVSHSSDAIISTSVDRNVISWNHGAKHLLGYSTEEMIGTSSLLLRPKELEVEHDEIVFSVLEGNSIESYETIQLKKDGTPIHVNMSMFPLIGEDGDIKGVSSILRDISGQKEAVEIKEAFTKKLEIMVNERTRELDDAKKELAISLENEKELGRLKSQFVSTASHQFRTPLAVIQASLGVLDMQKDDMTDAFKVRFDKVFNRVKEHIGRMTNLMDDALVIGKINAGSVLPVIVETDIVGLCEGLVSNYNEIQTDGRVMDFSVLGEQENINLDAMLIEHAISNLISNAFKYSSESEPPQLSVCFMEDEVNIVVKDFGIGIPDLELSHLFEPFYRASNTREYSGTGLGSAIAKEYVELNKGRIEVSSELDEGSEFTIILNKY